MPGILLPPATVALVAAQSAATAAQIATPTLSAYGGAIAPVPGFLTVISTNIGIILTAITPSGAVAPPAKLTIVNCQTVLTNVGVIASLIAATIVQSVALLGAPSPTYAPSAASVAAQLVSLASFIQIGFVLPQTI